MMTETNRRYRESEPPSNKAPAVKVLPSWRTLDGFVSKQGAAQSVAIDTLDAGASLHVHTRHSDYRLVVLDGPRHLVEVEGGTIFPNATIARLEGATAGGSLLKMGRLEVGLRMELSLGPRRVTSSRVESIDIEPGDRCLA
jgi:hypothetical protein